MGQAGIDDFVVLLGDLNGHVGAEADGYEGIHGGFGYGDRNVEGCRILEFSEAHGLVVVLHPQKLGRHVPLQSTPCRRHGFDESVN